MENTLKLVLMGVSILIVAMLISYGLGTLTAVKRTTGAQVEALTEIQSEYEQSDLLAMKNQIVSSAEAFSLARKYRYECDVQMNGVSLSEIGKDTFHSGANWIVRVNAQDTGAIVAINFESPSVTASEPESVEEAKTTIASIFGCGTDWSDIYDQLNEAKEGENYRKAIAGVVSLSESSTWDQVYSGVNQQLGLGSGVSLDVKKYTIGVGESCSYSGATFCYLVNGSGSGFVDCSTGTVYGTISGTNDSEGDVGVLYEDGVVTNWSGQLLTVTFVKQGN